jgi:hypothetical protein
LDRLKSKSNPGAVNPPAVRLIQAGLLSLRVRWALTEQLQFLLDLSWFLPLLAGWLAYRFGSRALHPLCWIGLLAVFDVNVSPTPALSFGLGFGLENFLLTCATAVTFAQPPDDPVNELFRGWWRRAFWLALFTLAVAALLGRTFTPSLPTP